MNLVNSYSSSATGYLDWRDRPDSLQSSISSAFKRLRDQDYSGWALYNGDTDYEFCDVSTYALIKTIIQQAPSNQKEFWFLDIGAGEFQWGEGLMRYLNAQKDLPSELRIHIVGVRGERFCGEREVTIDRCTVYRLGSFEVEKLFEKLKKRGFDLENKIDAAVTRWCFRHLVDPTGTLVQVFNLLRPERGFFLLDGFYLLDEKTNPQDTEWSERRRMTQLLLDMKAPFLAQYRDIHRSLNCFILRRPDSAPCQLPMSYAGALHVSENWGIGSNTITRFKREPQPLDEQGFETVEDGFLYGDKKLCDWLRKNKLLREPQKGWRYLQKNDFLPDHPIYSFKASKKEIQARLDEGHDINEVDYKGYTALSLAIAKADYECFDALLDLGANFWRFNKEYTPLGLAAACDKEGRFVERLIQKGAHEYSLLGKSPLQCAIDTRNLRVVRILIEAGVKISLKEHEALKAAPFASLHQEGIIPEFGLGGLSDVHDLIHMGDYVVLHCNGKQGMTYYYPDYYNLNPNLIYIDINPQTDLLSAEEWPAFLKEVGYRWAPYNPQDVDETRIAKTYHFQFGY